MAAKRKPLEEKESSVEDSRLTIKKLSYPPERPAGRIVGEGVDAVPELVAPPRLAQARDQILRLAEALAEHGVPSDTSTANFVLARFADAAEAEACDAFLKAEGLIVRRVAGYGLPHCLRITVGDEASCRRIAHAVGRFKAGEAAQ